VRLGDLQGVLSGDIHRGIDGYGNEMAIIPMWLAEKTHKDELIPD